MEERKAKEDMKKADEGRNHEGRFEQERCTADKSGLLVLFRLTSSSGESSSPGDTAGY